MWSALENIALRESLPSPLEAGDSIHDILIAGQLPRGRYNLHYLGRRRSRPYLLKQFYSIDTNAFLRWQNEARFIDLPQVDGYSWPCEEWRGGLISPFPEGISLEEWLEEDIPPLQSRLAAAAMLSGKIASLHRSGMCHRNLTPSSIWLGNESVTVTNFGSACSESWDDLWTDSAFDSKSVCYASPQVLKGESNGQEDDIYAFGAILHLLLSGRNAFGSLKRMLKQYFPGTVRPDALPPTDDIPPIAKELAQACIAPNPTERPTIFEAASALREYATQQYDLGERIRVATETDPTVPRRKIMVFITDDSRAVTLFDTALQKSTEAPSLFLFIGLIPGNLPSGHTERFKGNLFRKLSQGLARCRSAGLSWSLRVFENVDPQKAEEELTRQYEPDERL